MNRFRNALYETLCTLLVIGSLLVRYAASWFSRK
jgi:hypothetical protein